MMGNYCIQYGGICLSTLAKKVEQMDGQMETFEILAQLRLRIPVSIITFLILLRDKNLPATSKKSELL